MAHVDTRQQARENLLLHALLKVEADASGTEHRVKLRNLSPAGLMAEGDVKVSPGSRVSVELPNLGWVDGSVAWKQDNRFGIAFAREIDHRLITENP